MIIALAVTEVKEGLLAWFMSGALPPEHLFPLF